VTRSCSKLAAFAALFVALGASAADTQSSPQQAPAARGGASTSGVYKSTVTPHWFANNTRFWYLNALRGQAREFILVDAEKGARQPAFDHQKLAAALSKAAGRQFTADHLPFTAIQFSDDGKSIQFDAAGKTWRCDLDTYQCVSAVASSLRLEDVVSSLRLEDVVSSIRLEDVVSSIRLDPPIQEAPNASGDLDQIRNPPSPDGYGATSPQLAALEQREGGSAIRNPQSPGRRGGGGGGRSPDGKWSASVRDFNLYLRALPGGPEEQITRDGSAGNAYGRLEWSPDSRTLAAWQIVPGDQKLVYLIQSSPPGGGRAIERSRPYGQAGDKFTTWQLSLFDTAARKLVKPEVDPFEHEYESPVLHWSRDNSTVTWQQEDRGHQRMRLIEADTRSGAVRNLVDERTKTFIWTAHTEGLVPYGFRVFTWLQKTAEVIHLSEKDGWRHIYLIDCKTGENKQVTRGQWIIRGITSIDEERRQIWFVASGMRPGQDPYFINYGRVNFDGSGLVMLTDGDGTHGIGYSPDRKYIIDTYSRVDMPPASELRRVSDGKLVCKLEESDISELTERGFKTPEVFCAKGRDGQTDIWGIITRPANFDPSKKYPILENIYNGPQDSYVPKSFSANRNSAWGQLGFIVVQCDAMGTANRSKAFHDVCWHNLGDGGFPDRIAWIKAAAAKHPEMDLSRVGIFGTSAGGQNAAGAVIFHPEFYKAAVANSGCHDNRLDKASWNEQWMGYMPPDKIWSKDPDNWYSRSSNIDNAARLGGKLLLIVGELDDNVPPESTLRLVDALIKAGKDFDFLEVPGANHGAPSLITQRRTQDFLALNLLDKAPPNRNAAAR
jgi:dipeptidyl aminopeptidase/acylaminoacyl peptidase